MKKGDIIEKRREIPKGSILIRGCTSDEQAEEFMLTIDKHYDFNELPQMKVEVREGEGLCIVLEEDSYVVIRARINWVVDNEVAIEYLDTGGMVIFNLTEDEGKSWVVVHESTPVYQDSVEHMTDEQLRRSIEELRERRLAYPTIVKKKFTTITKEVQTPEDKQLSVVLANKSPEEKMELMRKLGLID